jgi:RHS repeat-associated protein
MSFQSALDSIIDWLRNLLGRTKLPPLADFSFSPQTGVAPLTVSFDGSGSYEPNGSVAAYAWDFGDGQQATGALVSHTFTDSGHYTITLTVTGSRGKTGSKSSSLVVQRQPQQPPIASFTLSPTSGIVPLEVSFDASSSTAPGGTVERYQWDFGDEGQGSGVTTTHTYTKVGTYTATLTVTDNLGVTASTSQTLTVNSDISAPPIEQGVATDLAGATEFIYKGENAVQTGIAEGTIQAQQVAILRGVVTDEGGQPLAGVKVTVVGHGEFGQTLSQADGTFNLAANGGMPLTLQYEKDSFPPVQRQVQVPWRDYVNVPTVVMIAYDNRVTPIDLSSSTPIQVAQSSVSQDSDGDRQAKLLIPQGTQAELVMADGTRQPLTNLSVRATEYTVGDNGPARMPAALPPSSGYTYCLEYSLDEVVAAGAKDVEFSQPLIHYVENFLGFPVGGIVPVGYYDREAAVWKASENGRIIQILSVANGLAELDVDGSGSPASADALSELNITGAERQQLASSYQPEQSLWRVPIQHFTPWDCNWPYGPPDDAEAPKTPDPRGDEREPESCSTGGSQIDIQNQVLGESLPIAGTPFSLVYQSDRVRGRTASFELEIPLTGDQLADSVRSIELKVELAGRQFTQSFPATQNLSYTFIWDGKDAYERLLHGTQSITIQTGYTYQAVYLEPAELRTSFGILSDSRILISGDRARSQITLWKNWKGSIGCWEAKAQGYGGWNLSIHHNYDPTSKVFYSGNGLQRRAADINQSITTVAGIGQQQGFNGDEGLATQIKLDSPKGIAVNSDGVLFIADTGNNRICQVQGNAISTLATASNVTCIAIAFDNSIYFTENEFIRRLDLEGKISIVAGTTDSNATDRSGVLATTVKITEPRGIAVSPDGDIYFSEKNLIRRIDSNGIITTVAGSHIRGEEGDGKSAKEAQLNYPKGVFTDDKGNIYIADYFNGKIRNIFPDGTIWRIAGTDENGNKDGLQATGSYIGRPEDVVSSPNGGLYILSATDMDEVDIWHRIFHVQNPVKGTAYVENHYVPGMKNIVYYKSTFFHVFSDYSSGHESIYLRTSFDGIYWNSKVQISDAANNVSAYCGSIVVWEDDNTIKVAIAWATRWNNSASLYNIPSQMYVSFSDDAGKTFNSSIQVSQNQKIRFSVSGNISVDGNGILFASWVESPYADHRWEIRFSRSSDNGNNWTIPTRVHSYNVNPYEKAYCHIAANGSGKVWIAACKNPNQDYRNPHSKYAILFRSTNSGESWQESLITNDQREEFTQTISLATGTDNVLYAVWLKLARSGVYQKSVMFSKSEDGGVTWSQERQVSEVLPYSRDQEIPSLIVGASGILYVVWSDDRVNPEDNEQIDIENDSAPYTNSGFRDIYLSFSTDNGNIWSRDFRISSSGMGSGVQRLPSMAPKSDASGQDEILITWRDSRFGLGRLQHRLLQKINETVEITEQSKDGILQLFAGDGQARYAGDGGVATNASFNRPSSLAIAPNGDIYIADTGNHCIRKISSTLSGFSGTDIAVSSEDGSELYQFNAVGQHLRTINTLTGTTLYEFGYDPKGLLTSVTDGDGNITQIERNPEGFVQAIISPYGHRTTLALNGDGYLEQLTDPAGSAYQFAYKDQGGLLETMTDPRENVYRFTYEDSGRLQEDADPAGGTKLITRTRNGSDTTVRLVTAMLRETTYRTERLPSGDKRMESRCCGGDSAVMIVGQDGSRSLRQPDGTGIRTETGPDPRWGMQAPLMTRQTITTPGTSTSNSLTTTIERQRLIAPNDPQLWQTLTEMVTINGKSYVSTYDKATKVTTYRTPEGRVSTTKLDDQGRVVEAQIPGRLPVQVVYDSWGRVERMTQGDRTYTLTYDDKDNLQTVTDPLNQTTKFEYDPVGRVTRQIAPDGREATFTYDPNGNVDSITPPGRPAHRFEYTPVDLEAKYTPPSLNGEDYSTSYIYNRDRQLEEIQRPDGKTVSLGYDDAGLLRTIDIARGQIRLDYDEKTWNLKTATAPDGGKIEYEYDGSLPIETRWSGEVSGSVQWSYDNNLRLASQKVNNAYEVKYEYDDDGLLKKAGEMTLHRDSDTGQLTGTELGTVKDFYTYNDFGELETYRVEANGNELMNVAYRRDRLGRIEWKEETMSGETHTYEYSYHPAGWLEEVKEDGVLTSRYEYDDNGNRLRHITPSEIIEATYDDQDRLLTYGNYRYTYTANGELETKTDTTTNEITTYEYDELGNLISVNLPSGDNIEYFTDSEGHRIGKKVNGTLVQAFLYRSGLSPIAELNSSNEIVNRFFYASRSNVPDWMIRGESIFRIYKDHLGSVRQVVNLLTGEVDQSINYDTFGNVLRDTNPGLQPYGFAGGLYDLNTKLIRFGYRDYNPDLGRWTAKDPSGFVDGENLYMYVLNDPLSFSDRYGLKKKKFSDYFKWFKRAKKTKEKIEKVSKSTEKLQNSDDDYDTIKAASEMCFFLLSNVKIPVLGKFYSEVPKKALEEGLDAVELSADRFEEELSDEGFSKRDLRNPGRLKDTPGGRLLQKVQDFIANL